MKKRVDKKDKQEKVIKKEPKKNKYLILKILLLVFIFGISFIYYMRFLEPSRIIVQEIKVESSKIPESLSGLKLVHISDLHYKTTNDEEYLKIVVKKINRLKPDLVAFTGDLLSKDIEYSEEDYKTLIKYFNLINANNKYYVLGDEDYKNNNSINILESSNFNSLNNSEDYIYGNDNSKIVFHGLGSFLKDDFNTTSAFISNDATYFNIALFHEPDNILELRDKNIDLAISGHSLNNRINLPIIREWLNVDGAKTYYNSYYNLNNTHLYINSGLGTNGNKLRLLTPPTINFYRIVKK